MKHIAIIYKRTRPEAAELTANLSHWFEERKIRVFSHENIDRSCASRDHESLIIPESVEAVVVLGGDGTFLSVARLLEKRSTPIMGVNLGGLGFLTEYSTESYFREFQQILDGNYEIEERMRLEISVLRGNQVIFRLGALNDAVINKGALARIIDLETTIDGRYLTRYRGDGLIVATPTGSTAYNLSAGGPIVYPTAQCIMLTPICPFTVSNRPIIFPPKVTVQIKPREPIQDVTLTCDGQIGYQLDSSDRIVISASTNPLRLIKTQSIDYFEILRTKLKWGQN
ncbi:NAD(+)/NADH kinase [Desulforhabdus amnigena]|jgi:NAD+ kinase|uniref:NAD kinase n=1 Tax=Desulforhabdus amnigena TaxID=40218 RepID=A0A9W6FS92_9BACT|nr:NAD(+)/NADH kinase [Desulforhabdus amnigena]NLJ26718.1 NAD(+)/NADH kinase [Deltaproteobacteria bacterium]GLI33813.1 NAD kinase [Desulforhabdus amnigena]